MSYPQGIQISPNTKTNSTAVTVTAKFDGSKFLFHEKNAAQMYCFLNLNFVF